MKTSIPSEVWENKRAEIAALYKEEEWPLKQVIKKIRSDDFNPTETQLRSRLKKWGVTKPSRQKRKKQGDGLTTCPTVKHPNRLELNTVNEPSSTQAAYFSTRVVWSDLKGWMVPSEYNQHHTLKDSPFLEEQYVATDWASSNSIANDTQCGNHPPFSLQHFTAPSPSYGHPNPATGSIANSAINAPIACHTRFTPSDTTISVSDSFVKTYPGEWPLQTSPVDTGSNPMTPWSYIASDVSQSCPSHIFTVSDGSPSVPDYTEYNNEPAPSEDYTQQYGAPPALSPNSDLELLQLDPEIKAWRRAASTHVRPDGIGTTIPRVGRVPLVRRRPEMKRKNDSSSVKQRMSTIQSHSEMMTQSTTHPNTSLSVSESNSSCQSALPSGVDMNQEYSGPNP
ncbi:hypothetical protein EMCG_08387 [[Emmonsia] crescens]|uniref:Clr5 domain-containing protein n=1 Tax=[Emmonsia] crescens TaxID=73230 RepID=A0A0G2I5J0_9EURO|nr:hypothetical protein EMCG_08387 [Emmonsia crescens UAMH 3008]